MEVHLKRCFLLAVGALICAGCGESSGLNEPTYPVSGTVTMNGQPIEGAVVAFVPVSGIPATGTTDASGKYTLSTRKQGDGIVAGSYKITIAKYDNPPAPAPAGGGGVDPATSTDPNFEEYPEDYDEMEASEHAASSATNMLPAKYAEADTSGFTAEVSGSNLSFDFDLVGEGGGGGGAAAESGKSES